MSYYINHINPSVGSVQELIGLRYRSMVCSGVPEQIASKVADPNNDTHIDRQYDMFRSDTIRHFGAYSLKNDRLVGYFRADDWHATDQLPFSQGLVEHAVLSARAGLADNTLPGLPLGVHELLIDNCDDGAEEVASMLLDRITLLADAREICTPTRNNQVVLRALGNHGFKSTFRRAAFPDGYKLLCQRPPYIFTLADYIESKQSQYEYR